MSKQVLILNVTRMGDVLQTIPLVARLGQEWPGAAIDMVVDQRMAGATTLVPGLRKVLTYDFSGCLHYNLPMRNNVASISPHLAAWVQLLKDTQYDRVINLTFTPRSGLLAAAIGAPDTRGIIATSREAVESQDPWLTYCVSLHEFRHLNQFNLVDLYALGGSGPGAGIPLNITVPEHVDTWAKRYLGVTEKGRDLISIQVGASTQLKAWRPEYVSRTMAAISRQAKVTFVLIGTASDADAVDQVIATYRKVDSHVSICNAVGQTDLTRLAALLKHSRLLLTNDSGPMHVAVGVGTPVIDISLGHVFFRETGPYGPGHWVIQPQIDCAPCVYNQDCLHHACKDQVVSEQVAQLALHCLGLRPFPSEWTDVGVYESGIDEDGLGCFRYRAGSRDATSDWYGTFWRRFWYQEFTGHMSQVPHTGTVQDLADQEELFHPFAASGKCAVTLASQLLHLSRQHPLDTDAMKEVNGELLTQRQRIMSMAMASHAFRPTAVALAQDLFHNNDGSLKQKIERQAHAYSVWNERNQRVMQQLGRLSCHRGSGPDSRLDMA